MKKKIKFAVIILLIGGMIMSYTRVNWQNAPSTATPVNAENLNTMDKGIDDAHSQLASIANKKRGSLYQSAISDMIASTSEESLKQFRAAITSGTVKIAIVGDSVTEGYDQTNLNDIYVNKVITSIKKKNPNVTVEYTNFALTGRNAANFLDETYKNYNKIGDDFCQNRDWVTDPDKVWREYVKDYAPDLLIFAFGVNETTAQEIYGQKIDKAYADSLDTLMAYIATWTKKPSICLVTSLLGTTNEQDAIDVFGYFPSQLVRQCVARVTRWYAKNKGYALADANRLWLLLRDGKDDVNRVSTWERFFEKFDSSDWIGDKEGFTLTNGVLTQTASNKFVTRDRLFYEGSVQMDIIPQANGDNGILYVYVRNNANLGSILYSIRPSGTNGVADGRIRIYTVDKAGTPNLIYDKAITLNTGTAYNIKMVSLGCTHTLYLNNVKVASADYYGMAHDGTIKIGGPLTTPPTISNLYLSYQDEIKYDAMFTNEELLGAYPNTDYSTSGDGIHHPSGLGHALAYTPAFVGIIDKAEKDISVIKDWTACALASGVTGNLYGVRIGNNVMVQGAVTLDVPTTVNATTIATIPPELKPHYAGTDAVTICMVVDSENTIGFAPVYIDSSLNVKVHGAVRGALVNIKSVYITITYLA